MSPVLPMDPEAPKETNNGDATATDPTGLESDPATAPETTKDGGPEHPTTPAPTNVEAYKPRGIRSNKLNSITISHVVLRFITAVFALIAFAVIASANASYQIGSLFDVTVVDTAHFQDFFYLSYLLTANVLVFTYALVTLVVFLVLLVRGKVLDNVYFLLSVFALDQILTYLLMSASTGAAVGVRAQKPDTDSLGFPDSFFATAYAAVAFSFLAFFVLAAMTLISGYRLARRIRDL